MNNKDVVKENIIEDIKVVNMNHEEFDNMIRLLNDTSITHQYLLNYMKFNFSTSITHDGSDNTNKYQLVYQDKEFMKKYTLTIEDNKLPYLTKCGFKICMKKDCDGNVIGVDTSNDTISDSKITFDDLEYFYDISIFITNYMEEL